jgi:hypothetical protein
MRCTIIKVILFPILAVLATIGIVAAVISFLSISAFGKLGGDEVDCAVHKV